MRQGFPKDSFCFITQFSVTPHHLLTFFFSLALSEKVEIKPSDAEKTQPNNLIVVLSSDRGLCGGIHSNLVKAVKATLAEKEGENTKIVACGEKSRQLFQRTHGRHNQ